jgi:interferon gamma-inducible protein 30
MSMTQTAFSKPSSNFKADNVIVTLYYESLCGGCHDWINQELVPTYEKLSKYMTVGFVPYGNAHQEPNGDSWEFDCQHGPNECKGNMQQSCIVNYVQDQDAQIDIIHCIENSGDITADHNVKKCLKDSSVATEMIDTIMACSTNEEGIQLHHKMGVKTDNLEPRHEYVPWVTFNNMHSQNDDTYHCQNLLHYCLCHNYLQDVPECANAKRNVSFKNW